MEDGVSVFALGRRGDLTLSTLRFGSVFRLDGASEIGDLPSTAN
jgi:hypothetical protein